MALRLILVILLVWCGNGAAQPASHHFEPPLVLYGVEPNVILGDIDGDGLKDLFWITLDDKPAHQEDWSSSIHVLRQLPGGHFDLPRVLYTCRCPLVLLNVVQMDEDPGHELVVESAEYFMSTREEFTYLDPTPLSGSDEVQVEIIGEAGLRYARLQALDMDLDGRDELFMITLADGLAPDFRQLLNVIVLKRDGNLGFDRQVGEAFVRPGDEPLEPDLAPEVNRQYPDMDADGLRDVMFHKCPFACLYRHDADGVLRLESALEQPGGVQPGSVDALAVNSFFADLDQDGVPDRVVWNAGGGVLLDLQKSKLNFNQVASFPVIENSLPSFPSVADVDNNGFVDVIYGDRDHLIYAMQTGPGTFAFRTLKHEYGDYNFSALVLTADLNSDGCMDALSVHRSVAYFRGRGCDPRSDLSVGVTSDGSGFDVSAWHSGGPMEFPGTIVRVAVAPSSDPFGFAAAKGYQVMPPDGCAVVPARHNRQVFDCRTDLLAEGQSRSWRFEIAKNQRMNDWNPVHIAAFVLGGSVDSTPGNNIARAKFIAAQRSTKPSLPARTPGRRNPAPGGSVHAGSRK